MITGKDGTKSQGNTASAQHVSNGSVGYTSPAQLAAKEPDMSEEPLAFGDYNAGLFSPKQFSAQPPVPPTDETQTNAGTVQQQFAAVQRKENTTGLPDQLKSGVEGLSGLSLDDVQVHYNSSEPAQLQAHAFAQGTSIHIAPGQEKHLHHEAWHVVQQKQGRVKPNVQLKGINVNTEASLEQEADLMGAKAASFGASFAVQQQQLPGTTNGTVQRMSSAAVVQRSSSENQDNDVAVAKAAMEKARREIANQQVGNVGQTEFSNDQNLGGAKDTERKSIAVSVDMNDGRGNQTIYITPGQRGALHQHAQNHHWDYRYFYQAVEYLGQYIVRDVEMGEMGQLKAVNENVKDTIQRAATVTGALNPGALKGPHLPLPVLANGTLNFLGVRGNNVTTGATGTSLNRQPTGTGVGGTRPTNWAHFIAMIGAVNPFKQGHHMHQDLGGDGTHDNLAPFTASLNGLHYTRVEQHVLGQTNAPPGSDQYADYSCIPNYGVNAGIRAWSKLQFNGMTGPNQLAAMVVAGLMTPLVAAGRGGVPLAGDIVAAEAWIDTYVDDTFPVDIDCTVNFIDYAPGGGMVAPAATATGNQVVNITNDF